MSKRSLKNYNKKKQFFYPCVSLQSTSQKFKDGKQQLSYANCPQKPKNIVVETKFLYPDSKTAETKIQSSNSISTYQKQRKFGQTVNSALKISLSGRTKNNQKSKTCFQKQCYRKSQKIINNLPEKLRQNMQRVYDLKQNKLKRGQPFEIQNIALKNGCIPQIIQQNAIKGRQNLSLIKICQRPKSYSEAVHYTNKNGIFSTQKMQIQRKKAKEVFANFNNDNRENNNANGNTIKFYKGTSNMFKAQNNKNLQGLSFHQLALRNITSNKAVRKQQCNSQVKILNINHQDRQSFQGNNQNNHSNQRKVFQRSSSKQKTQFLKPMWSRIKVIKTSIAQERNAQQIASSRPLSLNKVNEAINSNCKNSMNSNCKTSINSNCKTLMSIDFDLKTERGNTTLQSYADQHQSNETTQYDYQIRHQLNKFQKLSPRNATSVQDDDQSLQSSLVIAVGGKNIFGENYQRPSLNEFRESEAKHIQTTKNHRYTQIFPIRQTQKEINSQSFVDLQENNI